MARPLRSGISYRLWPSYPTVPGGISAETLAYTLATEFDLSQSCSLDRIWFYSPPGATVLPSRCGIWNVGTQTEVAGTDNSSPSWSGAAGSGWVSCSFSGVTLTAGDYKVAVYYGGGSEWFQANTSYWGTGGSGQNGISVGPLSRSRTTRRDQSGPEHVQPGIVGISALVWERRQRRELLGRCRGHPELGGAGTTPGDQAPLDR